MKVSQAKYKFWIDRNFLTDQKIRLKNFFICYNRYPNNFAEIMIAIGCFVLHINSIQFNKSKRQHFSFGKLQRNEK